MGRAASWAPPSREGPREGGWHPAPRSAVTQPSRAWEWRGATGLSDPFGLALDGCDSLYIADGFDDRVVRVRETGGGQTPLPAAGLNTPTGLAFPPTGVRP